MKRVVILGAGPTGLGAAYQLNKLGYKNWQIYEKNDYVGGLSASFRDSHGFTWDIGGHIIFSNSDKFNRLVNDLLGNEVLTFKRESWIWLRGSFVKYPFQNNFHLHPDKEVVLECVLGLFDNIHSKNSNKNFEDWISHHFGKGIAKHFMIPYNGKVWACPLEKMDYNWISERVSVIDIRKTLENIICQSEEGDWGANNTFHYPLTGGTGGLFNRFLPYIDCNLHLNKEVVKINPYKKEITFQDGEMVSYDTLITTIPLNELLYKMEGGGGGLGRVAGGLFSNSGYMVGIGLNKSCPSEKNWIYFPQGDSPFYRVTYLSNYSPNMTPEGDYFSLLAETSYSRFKAISKENIIEETIQGLINSNLLKEEDRLKIVSTYLIDTLYSYPIPFLGRDRVLKDIQSFLTGVSIYSRGRFGGWKYEVGNMDHSVLQGMEVVDRILMDEKETIYTI
ncbi:MAG TPA: FAD-dependent oxidoreductase [Nitrospirota bacterium]|nr:FAD-dependent oxidoreductase [Nitrospirota bacterium]